MDERATREERLWLDEVLKEARAQYEMYCKSDEALKREGFETRRALWEDVGSLSSGDGLQHFADFMSLIGDMQRQQRRHGVLQTRKHMYEKMLSSPYFGRIDFAPEGEEAKPYYIGAANLLSSAPKIYVHDWRAPVSGMFYDYETGMASYECPKGTVRGALTLKRQYKIENGSLSYMFDSGLKIDDEMLQQLLGKSASGKMKTIVTSIQREQNKAIRNEEFQNLMVYGPAGSGKTSIALHRIAYLLYKHRDTLTAKNIVIFSPNAIFNDYIASVLPELGESNMLQTTFESYMRRALRVDLKKEGYYQMFEHVLLSAEHPVNAGRIRSMRLKTSPAFNEALKAYAASLQAGAKRFFDVSFGEKPVILAAELTALFERDYASLPLKRRLEKMRARALYLLTPYEHERRKEVMRALGDADEHMSKAEIKRRSHEIVRAEAQSARSSIESQTEFDVLSIYRNFCARLAELMPDSVRAEAEFAARFTLSSLGEGLLLYEDQIAMLYLQSVAGDMPKTSGIRFVIIDEAQDYTPLQLEILRLLFPQAGLTMLGDLDQSIHPYLNAGGYESVLRVFEQNATQLLLLSKSYRSTVEITRFARRLLGKTDVSDAIERHGETPVMRGFSGEAALDAAIAEEANALLQKGYRSIGILTRTKKEAEGAYAALRERLPVKALLSGKAEFETGAVVMPAYLAKGIEFDAVFIRDAGAYQNEGERLLLYTACTRALHALHVYHTGAPSPVLAL